MKKFRLLTLLALLMTAATGAWAQTGMTNGSFSVSATKRVYFSKGNLQLVGENTFQFAENQWDVFGSSQSNGHRDLFGWGSANNPDLTSENNNDYSTFTDWGTKIGDGTTWRTLTNDEWDYVLNTRTASTLNGTENARYAYATVNGVGGLILFPDNYTHPGDVTAPAQINTPSNAFNANTYDVNAWDAMERAGAVFLPHGGWRKGNTHQSDQANYWSSTPSSAEDQASGLKVSGMVFASWYRYRGCAVRLVTDGYVLTLADGVKDAGKWTVKVGVGQAQALPIGGLNEGDAVTLQYNGRLKVKGVKATSDAAPAEPAGNPAPTTASIEDYTAGTFGWDGNGSAATGLPTINTFAANDGISILSANNTNTQFTTSAGGASATFSGTATDDSKFYAVYPYTPGLTISGDVISGIVIPTSQWNSGWNGDSDFSGWDPKAPIAYATTTGSSLTFHNACAILKVTFPVAGTYGRFTISANEPLAGTFSLDTSTGTLTPTSGSTSVSVGTSSWYSTGICTDFNGKTVYVAIAPGTYTGFNLHIYNEDDDEKSITKSTSVTFEAGKIYDLGSYNLRNL